jgi:beta-glucuronidase
MKLNRRTLLKLSGATTLGLGQSIAMPALAAEMMSTAPILHLKQREKVSLDGPWRYIIDPFDAGRRGDNARRTFWKNFKEGIDAPLVEYDWDESPIMNLPSDWNSHAPELLWYNGPIYFRRTFTAQRNADVRQFITCEAVNYSATLWLNAKKIGTHAGGFTPFSIDVTDMLLDGENALTICADSRHPAEAVPTDYTDWQNYGGVTRSVWLVSVPQTFVSDWFVRLEGNVIVADVTLTGPQAARQPVTVSLPGLTLSGITDPDGRIKLARVRPNRLKLWSPEAPILHTVEVSALGQRLTDQIGLRTIATRGTTLLFNGKPLFLRGTSMHEEPIGPVGTRRMQQADARALLTEAKALGCNFVRLAHYPHSEVTLRVADELGLIVWSEIPVYWEGIAYDSPNTLALANAMLGDMIRRDRNRCSIGIWSVANETPIIASRTRFLRSLIASARSLDKTRLITAALNKNVDVGGAIDGQSVFSVEDELGADLDILSVNQYEAWYSSRNPAQLSQVSFTTAYDKPIMFSEFGADALAGKRGDRTQRWTEDYQAWLYEETFKLIDRTPGCVGLSPWVFKDFRSPRRWHGKYQQFWNRKGVISETGVRKLAFTALQTYYARKAQM